MINLRANSRRFKESSRALVNPLMGYAPMADGTELSEDVSLVYVDITWRELEPQEGIFAWEEIEASNKLRQWRQLHTTIGRSKRWAYSSVVTGL